MSFLSKIRSFLQINHIRSLKALFIFMVMTAQMVKMEMFIAHSILMACAISISLTMLVFLIIVRKI